MHWKIYLLVALFNQRFASIIKCFLLNRGDGVTDSFDCRGLCAGIFRDFHHVTDRASGRVLRMPPIVIIVTFLLLSPFFRNVREPYSVYEMPPLPEEGVAEENGIEGIIQTRILRSRTITPLVF